MQRIILEVPALHCDGCIATVVQVLSNFPGIESIEGDLVEKQVIVNYDPASITATAMTKQLLEIGYPVANTRPG